MYGEHYMQDANRYAPYGLSPYARGTPDDFINEITEVRFIPVCTGNTDAVSGLCFLVTVYPRMHGEHTWQWRTARINNGLSPYARGTLFGVVFMWINLRFIPVCTGNTFQNESNFPRNSVYPRMHGEHQHILGNKDAARGLSPYARGTPRRTQKEKARLAVYPRMHGEHCRHQRHHSRKCGLSPYARGTQFKNRFSIFRFRFIPVCTGNTVDYYTAHVPHSVYPRMHGEHL